MNPEQRRLEDSSARTAHWKRWGPYLSDRAWGTVREDYSRNGSVWEYLPHDHARSRAYRWNEDGIAGICDRHQRICLAIALWNERDPILKERLFGLTGSQGNHGEDVKEYYFYLDSTPTHSYMKFAYKYPQEAYPYEDLLATTRCRDRSQDEYELLDTGIFDENRYFDVTVEYAKATPEDILARVTAVNRGPEVAALHLLPTIWFRNTWSWRQGEARPRMAGFPAVEGGTGTDRGTKGAAGAGSGVLPGPAGRGLGRARSFREPQSRYALIELEEPYYGTRWLFCEGAPELLFTENETNTRRLYGVADGPKFAKDAFHELLVNGSASAVNPQRSGTKAAAHYRVTLEPGESVMVRLRFTDWEPALPARGSTSRRGATRARRAGAASDRRLPEDPFGDFEKIFDDRLREADEFYAGVIPTDLSPDGRDVMRQALGGMLWSKQFYHYVIEQWLKGDPAQPLPPPERMRGRNHEWTHLYNADVISMPDKWEYPWYAAWDLAFHCISLALVDSDFAKEQLILMLREWYMHPNGQLPAYEWDFSDVNPPVHGWAAWRVYKIEEKRRGTGDRDFLERVFHKLLLNFTWWVNRKDLEGMNLFQGGFLGLDNIGVFDRGAPLPGGGHLEQSDGTSWMAMYTLNLLAIALELAREDPTYEDVASKFWEHFIYIANAMNHIGDEGIGMWNEDDGFFYDVLHMPNGENFPMKVRSMVGLIPLFAIQTLEPDLLDRMPGFQRRLQWFIENRPDLTRNVACMRTPGKQERRLLSVVSPDQLRRVLAKLLDEDEFLSPYGIRAVSRFHRDHPYVLSIEGQEHRVDYEPGDSRTSLFGGNSNWRGPIWFPVNFLVIESLQKFHHYLGDSFRVECPVGSGRMLTLWEVAAEISRRLTRIFLRGPDGRRPVHGRFEKFQQDLHWRDLILFHEYFHGDDGSGVGASHQTGWTGVVAKLIQQSGA